MKRFIESLHTLPLSRLLWIALLLLLIGGLLMFGGYRLMMQKEQIPTPTGPPEQSTILSATQPHTPTTPSNDIVHLAWFYKPPENGQLDLVAQNFDFFILTYKDEKERDRLKASGITAPFAQYLLLLVIDDPGGCEENPPGNQVAYKEGDFCQISEDHPDWFLLDQNGNRIKGGDDTYFMDPGNQEYRQFWLERAREMQETYGWDDLFLDNVEASLTKLDGDGTGPAKYPDDKSFAQAVEGFLAYLREDYFQPDGRMMYGNIVSEKDDSIRDRYIRQLDGVMIESFATDWDGDHRDQDDWEQQLDWAEKVLSQGKTLILVSQGDKDELDRQKFAFASYLLVADGDAVFRYTHSESYREVWLYDDYKLDLGTPQGERYFKQGVWRRDFSNGYVTVDPVNHKAEIVVNQ